MYQIVDQRVKNGDQKRILDYVPTVKLGLSYLNRNGLRDLYEANMIVLEAVPRAEVFLYYYGIMQEISEQLNDVELLTYQSKYSIKFVFPRARLIAIVSLFKNYEAYPITGNIQGDYDFKITTLVLKRLSRTWRLLRGASSEILQRNMINFSRMSASNELVRLDLTFKNPHIEQQIKLLCYEYSSNR